MTQTQIRVVRDTLEGKFKAAIEGLEVARNKQGTAAQAVARDRAPIVAKKLLGEMKMIVDAVNVLITEAENFGYQFSVLKGDRGSYHSTMARVTNVKVGITDEESMKVFTEAAEPWNAKIIALQELRESTYLSLYDVTGSPLADIVAQAVKAIAEITRK